MSRVALCGVFDIPNYGDHLFPLVCRNELKRRGYQGEVVLFSPFAAQERFVENSLVHSLDDLERMHRENPFDAIIVGGGEIIHWHRFGQKRDFSSASFTQYPMDKVWMIPSFMKMKYDIPLLWNAPGIPFAFDSGAQGARMLIDNVDYLSVRNAFSASVLHDIDIDDARVSIVPDTGFSLRSIASERQLYDAKEEIFPGLDNYVVFHCNRFIPPDAVADVASTLDELHDSGRNVVLLPLAYTHGDEDALRSINEHLSFDALLPDKPLSLLQIIGILANCDLYVGTSLHGSVTASVFGKPIVGFDYHQTKKTKDLYHQLGFDDYYITDATMLKDVVHCAIERQRPFDFSDMQACIDAHFDTICEYLDGKRRGNPASSHMMSDWADMTQTYFECLEQCKGLLKRQKELEEALQTNINFVTIFKARSESYAHDVEHIRQEYETLQRRISEHPLRTYYSIRKTHK